MRLPPLDQPWPTPNYINPQTHGPALLIVNSIFIGLAIITVLLRLYTRLVIKRWFGIDDVFIILALVFTMGLTAVVLLANTSYGWDRHVFDIPFSKIEPTLKIAMAAKLVFTSAATFTRLSLHCFYYRLVSDSGKAWFRWLVHINVAYTLAIFISFTFISVFLCHPVQNYWNILAPADSCLDEGIATFVCGIINCVADFLTTVTPVPLVIGLHMPRRQRLAVGMLFSMGIIVTIAGVVRTWYIYKSLIESYDQTWYAYPLWIAAAVEIDLGVICASAPVLRPLLAKIPFSLSETFSRAISTKSSKGTSKTSTKPGSIKPTVPIPSSRRAEKIQAIPELADDRGRSYELRHWDDVERAIMADGASGGSQESILNSGNESTSPKGLKGLWTKVKGDDRAQQDSMMITRTSEVDVQIEPVVHHQSKRTSRLRYSLMPGAKASTSKEHPLPH